MTQVLRQGGGYSTVLYATIRQVNLVYNPKTVTANTSYVKIILENISLFPEFWTLISYTRGLPVVVGLLIPTTNTIVYYRLQNRMAKRKREDTPVPSVSL